MGYRSPKSPTPVFNGETATRINERKLQGKQRSEPVLVLDQVCKSYGQSKKSKQESAITKALDNVSFSVMPAEFVGIMGPSGCGKSTLLNCISTIDVPDSGTIIADGMNLTQRSASELTDFRRDKLGFIFQESNLLDTLSGFDNIALALTIQKVRPAEIKNLVQAVAKNLNITDVLSKYPHQMSGGQRQRIAAARATITKPAIILADEPTGALDSHSARALLESLELLNRFGSTILMVTHDPVSASYCSRILMLKDGRLHRQIHRSEREREEFYREVMAVQAQMSEEA